MKKIIEILSKFGLITNTVVDPEKYTDVDDLINKGIVTVPGAKSKIMELLENAGLDPVSVTIDEKLPLTDTITEVKDDEPVTVTDTPEDVVPIDETPESPEVIDETPVEETPIEEVPVEEPTVVEEVVETPEEVPVEEAPKKKKSTKKAEQAE